jgi:hypothetical protein
VFKVHAKLLGIEEEVGPDPEQMEPMKKSKKATISLGDDPTHEDAYETNELYKIEESSDPNVLRGTLRRWIRILLRKYLLKTAAKFHDAVIHLKQYDIFGNVKPGGRDFGKDVKKKKKESKRATPAARTKTREGSSAKQGIGANVLSAAPDAKKRVTTVDMNNMVSVQLVAPLEVPLSTLFPIAVGG